MVLPGFDTIWQTIYKPRARCSSSLLVSMLGSAYYAEDVKILLGLSFTQQRIYKPRHRFLVSGA